ncbi:MAG TPA: MlaD family protein [Longimicrobiales bacterium]
MDKRTRSLAAVGALVLVAGGLFVWGLYYLMGNPIWQRTTDVMLVLEDAGGLKRNDRVHVNGVQVGTVRGVRLRRPGEVWVELRLEEGVVLPADTRARLTADFFGTSTVDLLPGTALVPLEEGDTIRGVSSRALADVISELGGRAESVLSNAGALLSPEALESVHATAAVLPSTAQELRATFQQLHLAAESLRHTAEGVESAEAGPALAAALEEFRGSARAFTAAASAMERSLTAMASVMAKIDQGEGTLGRLVNDSSLYAELHQAIREVRLLAADVRERPKRYVSIDVF